MIFLFNANGDKIDFIADNVYKGSNNANSLYFICPISKESLVSAHFILPNGERSLPNLLERVSTDEISQIVSDNGEQFNIWHRNLTNAITEETGQVSVQFAIALPDGSTMTTATNTFYIEEGAFSMNMSDLETQNDILVAIQYLQTNIDNLLHDSVFAIQDGVKDNLCSINESSKIEDSGIAKSNIILKDAVQTITGTKTFNSRTVFNGELAINGVGRYVRVMAKSSILGDADPRAVLYFPDKTGTIATELEVYASNSTSCILENERWSRLGTLSSLTVKNPFIATIDASAWESSLLGGVSGTFEFVFKEMSWLYEKNSVSLANYGITVTKYVSSFKYGDKIIVTRKNPYSVELTIIPRINLDFVSAISFRSDTNISISYPALTIHWSGDDITEGYFTPMGNKDYDIIIYNNSNDLNNPKLQAVVRGVSI